MSILQWFCRELKTSTMRFCSWVVLVGAGAFCHRVLPARTGPPRRRQPAAPAARTKTPTPSLWPSKLEQRSSLSLNNQLSPGVTQMF